MALRWWRLNGWGNGPLTIWRLNEANKWGNEVIHGVEHALQMSGIISFSGRRSGQYSGARRASVGHRLFLSSQLLNARRNIISMYCAHREFPRGAIPYRVLDAMSFKSLDIDRQTIDVHGLVVQESRMAPTQCW